MNARIPRSPASSARSISARQRTDFEASRIGDPAGAAEQIGGVAVERVEIDDRERRIEMGGCVFEFVMAGHFAMVPPVSIGT